MIEKIDFKLKEDEEYITLVNLLKTTGTVGTGGEVKILLLEEKIQYNDTIAFQKKKKCFKNDKIIVKEEIEINIK